MKIQIKDIIEVKFKNMPDVCHYYVCESDTLNTLNACLPYALISLDKGKVELCFHNLDFKEINYYLNHCDNANYYSKHSDNAKYGIESIGVYHKGEYKLVYNTVKKSNFSKPKKYRTSKDKETEQILNQMNKYHKIRKRKPKEHNNYIDELFTKYGRH